MRFIVERLSSIGNIFLFNFCNFLFLNLRMSELLISYFYVNIYYFSTFVSGIYPSSHLLSFMQNGCTALHVASENGHTDTVLALMDRGAQVDLQDKVGYIRMLVIVSRHDMTSATIDLKRNMMTMKSSASQFAILWNGIWEIL